MGTILGNNDVKTGIKSSVQSLGTNNPFTITTVGEVSAAVAVQGGTIEISMNSKYIKLCR